MTHLFNSETETQLPLATEISVDIRNMIDSVLERHPDLSTIEFGHLILQTAISWLAWTTVRRNTKSQTESQTP